MAVGLFAFDLFRGQLSYRTSIAAGVRGTATRTRMSVARRQARAAIARIAFVSLTLTWRTTRARVRATARVGTRFSVSRAARAAIARIAFVSLTLTWRTTRARVRATARVGTLVPGPWTDRRATVATSARRTRTSLRTIVTVITLAGTSGVRGATIAGSIIAVPAVTSRGWGPRGSSIPAIYPTFGAIPWWSATKVTPRISTAWRSPLRATLPRASRTSTASTAWRTTRARGATR